MSEETHDSDSDSEMMLGPTFLATARHYDGQLAYRKRDKETKPFVVEVKRPKARRVFVGSLPR